MDQPKPPSDQEILEKLRKPIEDLVNRLCPEIDEMERVRLRQLAWQAVDILVRRGNVANIKNEKEMLRITSDIRKIGASEEFIEESLLLAIAIYRRMQIDYPGLLKRYRGEK